MLCAGKLHRCFSLGDHYLSDFVAQDKVYAGLRSPLDVARCQQCRLVQLESAAPVDYRHYWYRSGVTATMRAALKDVAEAAARSADLQPGDVVLDIGSNDGTLLRCYGPQLIKVGVEPALNLAEAHSGVDVLVQDLWSYKSFADAVRQHTNALPSAKVITACGMLYDLKHPQEFISDVSMALHKDGVFVAQLMCLKQTLASQDIGNFCHEHLEYYTLHNLETMLENVGLKLVDVEENSVNGGSYRLYVKHKRVPVTSEQMKRVETARKVDWFSTGSSDVAAFWKRAEENKRKCVEYVRSCSGTVALYGASTKGNTILQYYGLDSDDILFASDRSPEKHGLYTAGTGIRIVPEEEARKLNPAHFLVMPYAFLPEFLEREAEWRKGGGKFLVPLPEFRVV